MGMAATPPMHEPQAASPASTMPHRHLIRRRSMLAGRRRAHGCCRVQSTGVTPRSAAWPAAEGANMGVAARAVMRMVLVARAAILEAVDEWSGRGVRGGGA